ncbi:MAG: tyrosine-type recombinase/integrase [Desulfobacteraceae bacterium]|nr:tyrosine-type recombinase/integrase [Desulfobacteraceae bacterium]
MRAIFGDQLAETLRKLLKTRKEEALRNGSGEVTGIIFHSNGNYIEQNHIRKVFKRLLTKAGLREIRVHDIRHTTASLLLSDGASPVYVKEQLGHTSIQMTVDIYGHLIPSSNRGAINKLDTRQSAPQTQPAQKQMA